MAAARDGLDVQGDLGEALRWIQILYPALHELDFPLTVVNSRWIDSASTFSALS